MELILHVIIALSSVAFTTFACALPTEQRLRMSYVLIALTLITGTYLVILNPGQLLQACMSGLAYVSLMTAMTAFSRYRLAQVAVNADDKH